MKKYLSKFQCIVLIVFLLICMFLAAPARAAGVVGDGSPGSCTEAALDAALAGGGTVMFNCGAGPVTLSITSQKIIDVDTSLDGAGKITLDGGGTTRLFSVLTGIKLNLNGLTLGHGSNIYGGAIFNMGELTISASTISDSTAPGGIGGAIDNQDGVVTITDSTLSDNTAAAGVAGCVDNSGTLTIRGSHFINNFAGYAGGAIVNNGEMTVSDSTFNLNRSPGGGGAIDNIGDLTIGFTTFYSNTASSGFGGAIYNGSTVTITASTFLTNTAHTGGGAIYNSDDALMALSFLSGNSVDAGNNGGGIYNASSSKLIIQTSTIAKNLAPGSRGGGIYNQGDLNLQADTLVGNAASAGVGGAVYNDSTGTATVTNSTFSANFGGMAGGGIIAGGPVTVTNSTFIRNTGGGLVNGGDLMQVQNTILADNTANNCNGTISSLGNNLEDADTCTFTASGDLPDTDPLVGPLANNGGPTQTYALLPGSPAINAGDHNDCPGTDQRGVPRLGACDIGAYEFVVKLYLPSLRK